MPPMIRNLLTEKGSKRVQELEASDISTTIKILNDPGMFENIDGWYSSLLCLVLWIFSNVQRRYFPDFCGCMLYYRSIGMVLCLQ